MAIDWSGYQTFGQGLGQAIGQGADAFGLSGKARAIADLNATLTGQQPQPGLLSKLQTFFRGTDNPAAPTPNQLPTLGGLSAPQTAPISTVPPPVPVTQGADLTAPQFNAAFNARNPNPSALKPMAISPVAAQTVQARVDPRFQQANPLAPIDPATAQQIRGIGDAPVSPATLANTSRPPTPGIDPRTIQDAPLPAGGVDINRAQTAIDKIEGGNYQAVGPITPNGDRAYGAHQVMGANIPAWTAQYAGRAMTPQEFLNDPAAQDAVFHGKFGELAQQYGPVGAAKVWFGGPKALNNPNLKDSLGTTVGGYAQQFAAGYGGGGGGQAPQTAAADATGAIPGQQPAAPQAAPQGFGSSIPTAALVRLATSQYLPDNDKQIVMSLLSARMPKGYEFIQGADGSIYRTNAQTGQVEQAATGGAKPTTDQLEYQQAVKQGFTGTIQDWIVGNKQAGATKVNVSNTQETALAGALGGAAGKMFGGMIEDGQAAKVDLANIGVLRDTLAKTGAGFAVGIQGKLQDWGINVGAGADDVQVAKAMLAHLVPAQRVAGSGTTSDRDLTQFQNALPKLVGTPGGNALIMDTMQAMAEFKQAQADIASRLAAGEFAKPNGQPDPAAAFKALRALPDPMAAWKANRASVLAGQPYGGTGFTPPAAAPVQVQTPEEAKRLPSGTPIILPDGRTGVVP